MSILAHDLRSPLNHVKGLTTLLQMTSDAKNSEQEKYFQLIHESIGRQQDMIARILDGAAIDSHDFNIHIEPVNLAKVLSSSVSTLKDVAEKKELKLNLGINCLDCIVEADLGYLTQVFENLISNAIKFSPLGKNIAISLYEKDDNIITEVKDEGPGISNDDMKKLFKRFSRLSTKPTAGEKSTGLGLSIVKKFVHAMNGHVWCESEVNKGTSFLVAFKKAKEKSYQKMNMA
jgi:signal transduction histidine kinase